MIRMTSVVFAAALTTFALTGCERSAQDSQQKAAQAQREAEQEIAETQRESVTKITSAQAEADQKIAEANADFIKTRDDYRQKLSSDLEDFNEKVQKLEAKAKTATGKTKAEFDAALPDIRARHQALRTRMTQLDMATTANWDATKNALDTDRDALKSAIDKAPSTL